MTTTVDRRAARVLLVDRDGRLLLFKGHDPLRPEDGTWWFTAGGGIDEGESARDAAARELLEETGLAIAPEQFTGPFYEEHAEFSIGDTFFRQDNEFFAVRVDKHDVDITRFTDLEVTFVLEHRWWTPEELRATHETVYPECLSELLDRLEV